MEAKRKNNRKMDLLNAVEQIERGEKDRVFGMTTFGIRYGSLKK